MKKIPLTQGKFALVDDADYELVSRYNWCAHKSHVTYYATTCINYESVSMHRLLLGLKKGDKRVVDHINHKGLDNRRNNIRICTCAQNIQNGCKPKNSKSKYKGIWWDKRAKRWIARICVGSFKSEIKAARAYDKAAKHHFGKFARLNNV